MSPLAEENIFSFGIAIIIGTLLGIEREKNKQGSKNLSAVGIRTSIFISLFGAVSAYLSQIYNNTIFIVAFIAMIALTMSSHIFLVIRHNRIGITTEISSVLLFLYGALCIIGPLHIPVILAILTALILSLRDYLHGIVKNINQRELFDTIKFAIIAFIILPFLPDKNFDSQLLGFLPSGHLDENFGSLEVLNPYKIWFLVVLISGISFLGYILVKTMGKRVGIILTGLMGGLYSSTATSLTLTHKSKEIKKTKLPFIAGITLACASSFIKIFILIRALNENLFWKTLIPVGLMFLYLLGIGLYLMFLAKKQKVEAQESFETPFKLKNALKLGGLITAALLIAKISLSYAGINFYYLIATAISFLAIDDPIIISTATSVGKLISYEQAKGIILLVIYLNMVQKVAVMYFFGNRELTKYLSYIFGGLFLVTMAGFLYF